MAKLVFYPAPEIFDRTRSFVTSGMQDKEDGLTFGRDRTPLPMTGITFSFGGIIRPSETWTEKTMFLDSRPAELGFQPQIMTEAVISKAPFEYELVTHDDIKPGKYSLEFHFTYFNGSTWKTSSKKVDFQVQNWFERNEGTVKTVGLILAGIGLARATVDVLAWMLSPFL